MSALPPGGNIFGIVSGQHGDEPYDGLELVRLTLPRRVYTAEHLEYVARAVAEVYRARSEIPGLGMIYAPEHLRFFQARFEPLGPMPNFAQDEYAQRQIVATR